MAVSRRPVAAPAGPLILFVNDSEGGQTIFLTGRFTVAGGGWRVSILMLILGSKYIRHKSSSVRSAGRGESYQTLKQSSRSVSQLATSQWWGKSKESLLKSTSFIFFFHLKIISKYLLILSGNSALYLY